MAGKRCYTSEHLIAKLRETETHRSQRGPDPDRKRTKRCSKHYTERK